MAHTYEWDPEAVAHIRQRWGSSSPEHGWFEIRSWLAAVAVLPAAAAVAESACAPRAQAVEVAPTGSGRNAQGPTAEAVWELPDTRSRSDTLIFGSSAGA